jgi:hypothetical protein
MFSADTIGFKSEEIHSIQWLSQQILHYQSEYSSDKFYTNIHLYLGSDEFDPQKIRQAEQGFFTQFYVLKPS